jgi:hypothetical protein
VVDTRCFKTFTRGSAGDCTVTTYFCPGGDSTVLLSASYSEEIFAEAVYQVSVGCFNTTAIEAPDLSVWNCFLPNSMPALSAKKFQMERQPLPIDEFKQAVDSVGRINGKI